MSLSLISEPIRIINTIDSNVCAMVSQIPYKFLRKDYTFVSVSDTSGDASISLGNDGIIENTSVGQLFYLDFDSVYTSGVYSISDVVDLGGGTKLVFDLPYTAPSSGYFNDLGGRANYTVDIEVVESDGVTPILENSIRYKPKQSGDLFVDLSQLIIGRVNQQIETQFKIKYSEVYNDTTQSTVTTDTVLGVLGKKQLLDDGGSVMWENLANGQDVVSFKTVELDGGGVYTNFVFPTGTDLSAYTMGDFATVDFEQYKGTYYVDLVDGASFYFIRLLVPFSGGYTAGTGLTLSEMSKPSGKFLTDFERPKVWEGWARSLSYILDDNLNARTGETGITIEAVNKNRIGGTISTYTDSQTTVGVKTFNLITTSGVDHQDLSMVMTAKTYSEVLTFDQETPCKNPVMIEWVNSKGGEDQHLFEVNQLVNNTVKEGSVFSKYIGDTIDNVSGSTGRISFDEQQVVTLVAEKLTPNFAKALSKMKSSSILRIWLDQQGTKKVDVTVVNDFTYNYQTNDSLVSYQVEIALPPNFDLFA